jgi:CMP-2-keto-3-deoxyoctulosonic acid synthetase
VDNNKKTETKSETAEIKFSRSVVGYTRKDKIRNSKIKEGLNIYNLNTKIIKPRSQWKYHMERMEDRWIPKKSLIYNHKENEK